MSVKTRYSDQELELFKIRVEEKLEKANNDLNFLNEQIQDTVDVREGEGDWMDETSIHTELEMLHTMANRQRKYIQDLENALIRIRNKSYGMCSITGELIDQRRLMAVPTTTKSLAAKNEAYRQQEERSMPPPVRAMRKKQRNIITRVIKPKAGVPSHFKTVAKDDLYDDPLEDDLFEGEDPADSEFDFDSLPAA